MRRAAIGIVAAAVLGALALGARAAHGVARRRAEADAARAIGRPVRVRWVLPSLSPPGVRLLDVRVEGVGRAPEVRVGRGIVRVESPVVRLVEPRRLRRARAPAEPGPDASVAAGGAAPRRLRLQVRDARVELPGLHAVARRAALDLAEGRPVRGAATGVSLRWSPGGRERIALEGLDLRAERAGDGARVHLAAGAATLREAALAGRPVGPFPVEVAGRVEWTDGVRVSDAFVRAGDLRVVLSGAWDAAGLRAEAHVARRPCADLPASLPPGLAPALEGMRVEGWLSASASVRWQRDADTAEVKVDLPALCRVVADGPAAPVARLAEPIEVEVAEVGGSRRRIALSEDSPSYTPLSRMGPYLPAAYVAAEDRRFWEHAGFDLSRIERALAHDLRAGAFAQGASTISQQLVKNVFLSHRRDLGRKLEEAVLTWRLEQAVPKRRILEVYLNVIETGDGLRGVAEAARRCFAKAPAELAPIEAAHLAALTPSPVRLSRRIAERGIDWPWTERLRVIVDAMRRQKVLSARDWVQARRYRLNVIGAAAGAPERADTAPASPAGPPG